MRTVIVSSLVRVVGCTGGKTNSATTVGADTARGSDDGCTSGPSTFDGLAVAFARSSTEIETYRFGAGQFTRDLMAGELSENTGTWTWSGSPDCVLELAHAAVPPDWPEAFTSVYVVRFSSATEGTFSVTRTFPDGFTYSGSGSVAVLP